MRNYRADKTAGRVKLELAENGIVEVKHEEFNSFTGESMGFDRNIHRYNLEEIDREIAANKKEALELQALKVDIISLEETRPIQEPKPIRE